jgi:hypothetical protein
MTTITPDTQPDLSAVEIFSDPFPHFFSPAALIGDASLLVLEWFEASAPWRLVESDFYEQYEFSFWDVGVPSHLSFLKDQPFLNALKVKMEEVFVTRLKESIDITAHQLIPGQRIRIHNDYIPERETHRLLIQLNRGWADENGGLLLFFNSPNPADVHQIFRPTHNSAVGFAISPNSNHAVSIIHSGERFTLVYSFYAEAAHV